MMSNVLTYLVHHPAQFGISVRQPVALYLLLVLPFFFSHVAGQRKWPSLLRAAAWLALTLVLAGTRLAVSLPDRRVMLIATIDVSDSVGKQAMSTARAYLGRLVTYLAPDDEIAIVTFAGKSHVAQLPGRPSVLAELSQPADRSATDLANALQTAAALFSGNTQRRILLFSDGNETQGRGRQELPRLRSQGIRVDIVTVPLASQHPLVIDKLITPPLVAANEVFPVRIIAYNRGSAHTARLHLTVDGRKIEGRSTRFMSGVNSFEIPLRLSGLGEHRIRVDIIDAHSSPVPGSREASTTVAGPAGILLVTRKRRSVIADVLGRRGISVRTRSPRRFHGSRQELLAHRCVILDDVTGDDLQVAALRGLEDYVRNGGGGLLVRGGGFTFGDRRLHHTPLQRMLPVTLEPNRPQPAQRDPLALVILIDRSNSMGYNSRNRSVRDGEKLRYARTAAISVIHQLKDQDRVGVIAFDSRMHEIAPLRPLKRNRKLLERDLPRLVENGGTDFFGALVAARDQLASTPARTRHIVLLTDGDTNRAAADHYPLLDTLSAAGISVTTIRIGLDDVNLDLLRDISSRTGGEFYHVADASMLPDLLLQDTARAMGPGSRGQEFHVRSGQTTEILKGIDTNDIPPLSGYAYAQTKDGAEILLQSARGDRLDPILAVWEYGLGRVAALTAGADDAERWPGWSDFGRFWTQLVHWVERPAAAGDCALEVHRFEGRSQLRVRTFTPQDAVPPIEALVMTGTGNGIAVPLSQVDSRIYAGDLPDLPPARYPVVVRRQTGGGVAAEYRSSIVLPGLSESSDKEYRARRINQPLLNEIATQTGGAVDPDPADMIQRKPGKRHLEVVLDDALIPLAMLLFLADVTIRRIGRK